MGGSGPGEANVISGNDRDGVRIPGADGNTVKGNFIGTDASGTAPIGNGWGVATFGHAKKTHATGTSRRELCLTGGAGVQQEVTGLHPNTDYTLSGWLRVSDKKGAVTLGVRVAGGKEASAATNSTEWVRKAVSFRTGAKQTSCTVFVRQTMAAGQAWADNLALPLTPAGR